MNDTKTIDLNSGWTVTSKTTNPLGPFLLVFTFVVLIFLRVRDIDKSMQKIEAAISNITATNGVYTANE